MKKMLTPVEVREHLAEFGCELITELHTGTNENFLQQYWRTASGFTFTVPCIGPDKRCPEDRLYTILAELASRVGNGNAR